MTDVERLALLILAMLLATAVFALLDRHWSPDERWRRRQSSLDAIRALPIRRNRRR